MRSDHSKQRGEEGRPVQVAFNDAKSAKPSDIFVQPDGRYVVRGPRAREHIFEKTGELVTSLVRAKKLHQRKVRAGTRTQVTAEQLEAFREVIK